MPQKPKLEKHVKPAEPVPAIENPAFIDFANAGLKADEVEPGKPKPREKIRLCFEIDKDINDAIEVEVNSRRTKTSKTQWVIAAILKSLKWKNKA